MYVRWEQIACSSLGNAAQFAATETVCGDSKREGEKDKEREGDGGRERGRVMYK